MRGASILFALALGCGAANPATESRTIAHFADPPLCTFEGEWSNDGVRTLNGGVPFANVREMAGRGDLLPNAGEPRLQVSLSADGWSLQGRLDPREDFPLSTRELLWLHEGVAILPGARPRIADARSGEVLLERTQGAHTEEDGFRFLAPPTRWAPCSALAPGGHLRARYEAVAPPDAPLRLLPASARAELSVEPGGTAFVEIAPREDAISVRVAEQRGEYTRIVIDDWSGTLVVGWLASSILSDEEPGMGGLGMSGGRSRTYTMCTSREPLAVYVSGEEVGSIAPGTPYVLDMPHRDGSLWVSPDTRRLARTGGDVMWIVRPTAPPRCNRLTTAPPNLRGEPDAVVTVRATVTRAQGAIANGAACEATVEHFGGDAPTCRAQIRCGDRVLFGLQQSNGFFDCQFTAGGSPSVVGEDPETTSVSRDAAMRIDTPLRRLTVDDDASGPAGEIHLEARIDSVALR